MEQQRADVHDAEQQAEKAKGEKRKAVDELAEEAKRRKQAEQQAAAAGEKVSILEEEWQCKVCLDAPSDAMCLPCRHVAGCVACIEMCRTQQGKCPICQKRITKVQTIFFS